MDFWLAGWKSVSPLHQYYNTMPVAILVPKARLPSLSPGAARKSDTPSMIGMPRHLLLIGQGRVDKYPALPVQFLRFIAAYRHVEISTHTELLTSVCDRLNFAVGQFACCADLIVATLLLNREIGPEQRPEEPVES